MLHPKNVKCYFFRIKTWSFRINFFSLYHACFAANWSSSISNFLTPSNSRGLIEISIYYFIYSCLNHILKLGLRDIIYMVHKFVDHKVVYRYVFLLLRAFFPIPLLFLWYPKI